MKQGKVLAQYNLWDIPHTMIATFKAIIDKYPGKPIVITVWEYETEIQPEGVE